MNHHADEGADDDQRIHFDQRTFTLALPDVLPDKLINVAYKFLPEHLRQLVTFERRVKEESLKFRIAIVMVQRIERESFKNSTIISLLQDVADHVKWIHDVFVARFVIEDGAVEFFFRGKMAKDHGFRNARCLRDFFCGGATKSPLRENSHRGAENLQSALFAGHPADSQAAGITCCRDAGFGQLSLPLSERSEYLLTIRLAKLSNPELIH